MRKLLTLALGLLAVVGTGCYRFAVADSVLYDLQGQVDYHIDADPGRHPDVPAYSGDSHRTALWKLYPYLDVNGWVIISDDSVDVTPEAWASFVSDVVTLVGDDQCIAWVLPVHLEYPEIAAARAQTVRDLLPTQPCYALIEWPAVVAADPSLLRDSVHPSAQGVLVLIWIIEEATHP